MNNNIYSSNAIIIRILYILLSIILWISFFRIVLEGRLFFDGLIYSSISRNLSEGYGSIWRPHFATELFPVFAEHPPLAFWLQSIFFRIFGSETWVEKYFSTLILMASAVILIGIWRRLTVSQPQVRGLAAYPLALALLSDPVSWSFANNMLEGTLFVFASLAVLLILVAYDNDQHKLARYGLICCAGLAITAAVLTKGPVGLFPLAAFGLHWLAIRRTSLGRAVFDSFCCGMIVLAAFAILWIVPEARGYLIRYMDAQLVASLSGARGNLGGGLQGVVIMMAAVALPLIVAVAIWATVRFSYDQTSRDHLSKKRRDVLPAATFCLLLGLSASLPILVSPRVSSFYFAPSVPFFALALALWSSPALFHLLGQMHRRWPAAQSALLGISVGTFAIVLLASWGRLGGDREIIHDVDLIAQHVCDDMSQCRMSIAICDRSWQDWKLHSYLQRWNRISLRRQSSSAQFEFLIWTDTCDPYDGSEFTDTHLQLLNYRLLSFQSPN